MKRPPLKELIPAAIVFAFMAAAALLAMVLLVSALSGRPADPAVTAGLLSFMGVCVPALITLYLRDSQRPPDPREQEAREAEDRARETIRDFLERTKRDLIGWRPKWRLSG